MESVKKITYQRVENYEFIKEIFLEKIISMKGSIPSGFDNDLFLSAFIKVYDYLTKKFKDVKIKTNEIPDVSRFEKREEYTISQFIFNRIINNIEKIDIDVGDDQPETCGGRYSASEKTLEIFQTTIEKTSEYEFEKYKSLNFETMEDFNKIITEYFIIHEIIHAISFNEFSLGFRSVDKSVGLNEGFTDSLALEISGFGAFVQYLPEQLNDNTYCMIPKNSVSGYVMETNIADLIRIVSKKDLTIPYLVNGEKVKWANIDKDFDETCYPLGEQRDVYGFLEKELYEITRRDIPLAKEEKIDRFQKLQGYLIDDIVKNKYNNKFLDLIKTNEITYEQAMAFDKDLSTIINKIVMSFPKETAKQILMYGANTLEVYDVNKLKQMIKNGKIEETTNVLNLIRLLEVKYEVIEILNIKKEGNLSV